MNELSLRILTPHSLRSPSWGRLIFSLIREGAPEFFPEEFGSSQPFIYTAEGEDVESLVSRWNNPFLWKAGRGSCEGSIFVGQKHRHHGYINIDAAKVPNSARTALELLKRLTRAVDVDFGYIHACSEREFESLPCEMTAPLDQGISTFDLQRCVPNLGWTTYFGTPYVALLHKERLLNPLVHRVEEIRSGVLLQLTERLEDVEEDFDTFDAIRRQVKRHLGGRAFYSVENSGEKCDVPTFEFSDVDPIAV